MPPATPARRCEPERSLTWPPPISIVTGVTGDGPTGHKGEREPVSAAPQSKTAHDYFEDDLNEHPEHHFLSPIQMYEYEDWADDSDEDAEEIEWDAGITDFALFDDDRRGAEESNKPLPSKWNDMLAQQASALRRAVERNRADSDPSLMNGSLLAPKDELPSLTPDTSPSLRDDLDVESYHGQTVARPSVPNYLTITVTPPGHENDEAVEDDEDMPLSFYVAKKQIRSKPDRRLERPGLRHSRTMSGQVHAWRRPSFKMFTVGEDAEAERRAELRTGGRGRIEDSEEGQGPGRG